VIWAGIGTGPAQGGVTSGVTAGVTRGGGTSPAVLAGGHPQAGYALVVPLAFPSHQGLIAPLWRRWPSRFQVLGCCVGAAVPDIVDGAYGLLRGHLGQAYGHSLLGLLLLCVPTGLALNAAIKWVGRALDRTATGARLRWLARSIHRWSAAPTRSVEVMSVAVGAFSHLVFDFVSHGNFLLLLPWYEDEAFFPAFWYAHWADVRLPFYERPYPIGPHFAVWTALSVAGAWLLFAPGQEPPSSAGGDDRTRANVRLGDANRSRP
jgi:hypothetical protein